LAHSLDKKGNFVPSQVPRVLRSGRGASVGALVLLVIYGFVKKKA